MQKMFSTRLEEATLNEMERATRRLGISKRQFLEEAIQLRAEQMSRGDQGDVWSETMGAWRRSERADTTIQKGRRRFQRSFERHHQAGHARLHR